MVMLSANELKTRGVTAIAAALQDETEAMISVRGKSEFVVLRMSEYNRLRECELAAAVLESRTNLADGNAHSDGIDEHIRRITGNAI